MNPDVLKQIRVEIIDAGRDTRYKINAYAFMLAGLEFCRTKIGHRRHVSGQELTRALVEFADKQFGPMTLSVLKNWGIRATDDFGYIVYNLIDIHVLRRQESDSIHDFFDVLDLDEYFGRTDHYQIDKKLIKSIAGA